MKKFFVLFGVLFCCNLISGQTCATDSAKAHQTTQIEKSSRKKTMDNIVFTRLLDAIEGEYDAFYSVSSPDSVIAIRDGKYIHINFITGEDQVIGKCREEAQPDRYLREDSDDFFLMYPRFGD